MLLPTCWKVWRVWLACIDKGKSRLVTMSRLLKMQRAKSTEDSRNCEATQTIGVPCKKSAWHAHTTTPKDKCDLHSCRRATLLVSVGYQLSILVTEPWKLYIAYALLAMVFLYTMLEQYY